MGMNTATPRSDAELLAAYNAAEALELSLRVRRGRPATPAQIDAWMEAARALNVARAAYRNARNY